MTDAPPKRKVLLIGWDAADWEHIHPLLDEGLMPTLDGLINRGVMGNLATLQPILSPMLWNSVATGKFADKHGIHGFIEPDPVNGGARPYTSTSRKCKALWNILSQSGLRSNIVGWWASHPAEPIHGTVVTNAFGGVKFDPEHGWRVPAGAVHPEEKGPFLARFKVFPHELTPEHILPFIPDAARIDQTKDKRLQTFARILSDAASIHAVATTLMETEPWDFTAVYYDAVDHFSHGFMPYHPPRMDWIEEEDFQLYKDVVKGAYRFHDMMLERLLHLAGPETTVILCSDHGFESGSQRPRGTPREPAGPAIWHRQYGIFVMAGPGIQRDERIYGASLIDIAPTVLTLFDLPIGEDMDGRPLLEAFEVPPEVETITSWETKAGACGMHTEGKEIDRDQAHELMQQFAALGYIEDPGADKEKQAESADIEAKYGRAEKLFDLPPIPSRGERLEILLRERPDPKRDEPKSGKTFVLVSGLPRSGTSLMMQVLAAGGLPVLTDGERSADVDNPKGYFEWEAIKRIAKEPALLDDEALNGHAIKCISMLLPAMPTKHHYKVILMTRPIAEIARSQHDMMKRLQTKGAELDDAQLQRGLTAHREEIRRWLDAAPHVEWFEADYPTLVNDSASVLPRLIGFIGSDQFPSAERMAVVIDPSLHRQKTTSASSVAR